jgi:hypothetical protein
VGKLGENRWKPEKGPAPAKVGATQLPKSVSPTGSSSPSPTIVPNDTTSKSGVKDKIATLSSAPPTSEPVPNPAPERRGSGTSSRIAALAGAVNVNAIGPRSVMPPKIPSGGAKIDAPSDVSVSPSDDSPILKSPSPEKVEITVEKIDQTNTSVEKAGPVIDQTEISDKAGPGVNKVGASPERRGSATSSDTNIEEDKAKVESKRPQSSRIAALGGLVNVGALGGAPRPIVPKSTLPTVVPEDPVPLLESHHSANPVMPTLKEEEEEVRLNKFNRESLLC